MDKTNERLDPLYIVTKKLKKHKSEEMSTLAQNYTIMGLK